MPTPVPSLGACVHSHNEFPRETLKIFFESENDLSAVAYHPLANGCCSLFV